MNKKGFTLIELVAVIAVIGIVSIIAIVGINRYLARGYQQQLKIIRNTIEDATDNYRIYNTLAQGIDLPLNSLKPDYLDASINYRRNSLCSIDNNAGRIKYVTKAERLPDLETYEKEYYCIYFSCNGDVLIDDYTDKDYCANN